MMIKKTLLLAAACCLSAPLFATDLGQSLAGAWTGSLQYRDFGNDRQVVLPTQVTFSGPATALQGDYIYDDGPGKTVRSREQWSLAPDASTLTTQASGTPAHVTTFTGGNGNDVTLEAEGTGIENRQAVAVRTLLARRGDTLTITRLTQLPGQSWLMRHVYRLERKQ